MIKEEIFNEIKKEMVKNKTWKDVLVLSCVSEGIITYQIVKDNFITEICIISDDSFFKTENPIELFRKKRILFLSHAIYINDNDQERIRYKVYKPLADLNLN